VAWVSNPWVAAYRWKPMPRRRLSSAPLARGRLQAAMRQRYLGRSSTWIVPARTARVDKGRSGTRAEQSHGVGDCSEAWPDRLPARASVRSYRSVKFLLLTSGRSFDSRVRATTADERRRGRGTALEARGRRARVRLPSVSGVSEISTAILRRHDDRALLGERKVGVFDGPRVGGEVIIIVRSLSGRRPSFAAGRRRSTPCQQPRLIPWPASLIASSTS
jgi:hypothetical protein